MKQKFGDLRVVMRGACHLFERELIHEDAAREERASGRWRMFHPWYLCMDTRFSHGTRFALDGSRPYSIAAREDFKYRIKDIVAYGDGRGRYFRLRYKGEVNVDV